MVSDSKPFYDRVSRFYDRLVVLSLAEPETPRAGVEWYRWLHRHFPHFIDGRPIAPERVLVAPGFDVAAGSSL